MAILRVLFRRERGAKDRVIVARGTERGRAERLLALIVGSDPETEPVDSEDLVAATRSNVMCVGAGAGEPVVIRGGRFVFDTVNKDLLIEMLPSLVHVVYGEPGSDRTRMLLAMIEAETLTARPGSELVIARLMELLLVEVLRGEPPSGAALPAGLLRGLADPVTARALAAIHRDIARSWTTHQLARLCGCSRSAFNQRFTKVVGVAATSYLARWRMVVAKDELHGAAERGGNRSRLGSIPGLRSGRPSHIAVQLVGSGSASSFTPWPRVNSQHALVTLWVGPASGSIVASGRFTMRLASSLLVAAVFLPACLDLRDGAALSDLNTAGISIVSSLRPSSEGDPIRGHAIGIAIYTGTPNTEEKCPKVSDDVSVTVDGAEMDVVSRGKWNEAVLDLKPSWCTNPSFTITGLPAMPTGTISTIVVADHTTRWVIQAHDLLAEDLVARPLVSHDGENELTATWASATPGSISTVYALALPSQPSNLAWSWWAVDTVNPASPLRVTGNQIVLDLPTDIHGLDLDVDRSGSADACDGPVSCSVEVEAWVELAF